MYISVVIPVYGCKGALHPLHDRLVTALEKITEDFEIILVNDDCPQGSWEVIKEICEKDTRVIGLNMSRNFGQIKAIKAGLDHAQGEWVVVMDCDLQDQPEEIINLYSKAQEGYDVVFARREERKDSFFKKLGSKSFYKVYDYFTDGNYDNTICNFSICKKLVIENYLKMGEQNRAFVLFIKWMGFKQAAINVEHCMRAEGKSSYNFKRKFKLAAEIITAQSNKPLVFSIKIGFFVSLLAFIYAIYLVLKYIITGVSVEGWTSIIVSIYLVGGLILMNLGVLGLYIGYIFNETKNRPLYIIMEKLNYKK